MSDDLICRDLRFSYEADGDVLTYDCTFVGGRVTALMGTSGSGKSTLLSLIAGFEKAKSGHILYGSDEITDLPPAARPVSMVFQEHNLFSHLSVMKNAGLGLRADLKLSAADKKKISETLRVVGLEGKDERLPDALSGGERQRVAIARALLRDKPILLLDEAFASLGPGLRDDMRELVRKLARDRAMSVIMVTHDPDDALAIADDLVFLADGRVALAGEAKALLENPPLAALQAYLGSQT